MADRAGAVRAGFVHTGNFTPAWHTAHPAAWAAPGWVPGAAWAAVAWPTLSAWWNLSAPPVYFDYGNTIVYHNNNVYVNGTEAGTAPQYAERAINLADQGRTVTPPAMDTWQPLGVFGLVQGDEKTSNQIFQLAVNNQGIIRGNFYDAVMDSTEQVYGSVASRTGRAAWTIGKKGNRAFETGVYNLTKKETPVLVHFGKERTQQWLLVRMDKPAPE
jgi:hypothetical protein